MGPGLAARRVVRRPRVSSLHVEQPAYDAAVSKHLDVRYFKTSQDGDNIEAGIMPCMYVETNDNVAGFFTKSLMRPAFSRFQRFLVNLPSGF